MLLYIHIPFCASKCGYCAFNSVIDSKDLYPMYIQALCEDIRISLERYLSHGKLQSVFIGGGTPNILPAHYYDDILHYNEKDEILWKYVKAGDKISALTKCMEEIKVGNREFTDAFETTKKSLENMNMPVVDEFIKEFIPSFQLTLDKLE